MDTEPGYDTTNLRTLRRELQRLNDAATKDGLIARQAGSPEARTAAAPANRMHAGSSGEDTAPAPDAPAELGPAASTDAGKARAKRLLAMLGRFEGDESPPVPGTDFTENGVVRLLAHLRRPRSQQNPFLQRLHRFLVRPVSMGVRTSAGVGVERLQRVSHLLLRIEAHGLHDFRLLRAARRGKQASPSQAEPSAVTERPARARAVPGNRKTAAVESR